MKKARDTEAESPEQFDRQLERLRVLVERMEHGGLSLDESLRLFEEGIRLSGDLFKMLNQAEGRVEELLANMDRVTFSRGGE